jgi:DNA topoisomerase-1
MSLDASRPPAAVQGLVHSDPRAPGITRQRGPAYLDPSGAPVTDPATLQRISALVIPPAWTDVWISPDPLGHIQATGVDRRGRTQYRYHQLWREQRDAQKFTHMLRFVRLIDLGLFRIGGERYAELDHHYGATTLRREHVTVTGDGLRFDYIAKEGKHREITVTDPAVRPTVAALAASDTGLETLFCYSRDGAWHALHSRDVSGYIAARAGAHFTAKEFRTWNATVLMALALAGASPAATAQARTKTIAAAIHTVAAWLGDTPGVARNSYVDPGLITRYQARGELPGVPVLPAVLPAPAQAEAAVAALLAAPA